MRRATAFADVARGIAEISDKKVTCTSAQVSRS